MKITDYRLLTANIPTDLTATVKGLMFDGWELLGGIAAIGFPNTQPNRQYCQAMVKREAE